MEFHEIMRGEVLVRSRRLWCCQVVYTRPQFNKINKCGSSRSRHRITQFVPRHACQMFCNFYPAQPAPHPPLSTTSPLLLLLRLLPKASQLICAKKHHSPFSNRSVARTIADFEMQFVGNSSALVTTWFPFVRKRIISTHLRQLL